MHPGTDPCRHGDAVFGRSTTLISYEVHLGEEKMWNNRDRQISELDAWMPESKNAESRVPGHLNADYIDERLVRSRGRDFSSFSCNGRDLSNFAVQDKEPHREFWLNREPLRQAMPSRKLSKSVNGSHNYINGLGFERARYVNREEDLYSSQEMRPIHRSNLHAQIDLHGQTTVPHLEEELYPSMTAMMNHRAAAYHSQGYSANILKNGMESQRAAFEGVMTKYTSDYNNSQSQNLQYERRFMGQSDYPIHSFAGPYDHPYARFQGCNGQFSGGSHSLELSSCEDGSYSFPSGPPLASQRDMTLLPTSNKCTCCKEHAHMQLPPLPPSSLRPHAHAPTVTKYLPMGYQHMQTHGHVQDRNAYGRLSSSSSSHNSLRKVQSHRKTADPHSQARSVVLARKENRPPLPGPGASPYVLCQGCDKVIQVPAQLHVEGAVLKLRCGACRRISKFCNIVHPCYQELLKERSATGSMQRGYDTDSLSQPKMLSAAETVEIKKNSIIGGPMSAKLTEDFGSSCVVGERLDKEDKRNVVRANGTHDALQNLEAFTPGMPLEEGPGDSEWRGRGRFRPWSISGTIHEDSSSLFSVSGSLSTKNTGGVKSYESQQLDTHLNFDSQCLMPEEGVQAKAAGVTADFTHEKSETRLRVSPDELQGLMLECLQGSSYDGLKGETKASTVLLQNNELTHVNHDEPVSLSSNDDQGVVDLALKQQIDPLEHNEPVRLRPDSDQGQLDLPSREQTECHNSEKVHGKVEVYNDGSNSAPAPGSPLYEHLSYDSASEIVDTLKNKVESKQTAGVLSVQETSRGSNFLTSFLKKSIHIGNTGQGNHKNICVVVNGMIIPPDAVKSAERQAGPIRPGVYWYDYQAGFWGVMSGPCLGIIPPFIEEFKRPLAKDCSGGTTGVFINGRELHKKDLDALAGRGLPRSPGKAYMVDISGQVVDGSSGQMLRSLGRLAPTVQKRGRGCGMFQPPSLS